MKIERRGFLETIVAAGASAAALLKGIDAFAKGIPSNPGESAAQPGPDEMALPAFDKDSPFPLEKALTLRKSSRNYDPDASLSPEQLSRLLWAANGVNRDDGHRTTPSAVFRYPVDIIAALPGGTYRFDTEKHILVKVTGQDIRREISIQPGFKKAAMILLYVINDKKVPGGEMAWADIEIGCMVQSTYLEAMSLGLGACVFALVKYDKVSELIGLKEKQTLRIAQAVGPLKD